MENVIPDPLWRLMLKTHGCDPGCGCQADFLDLMDVETLVRKSGISSAEMAITQIDELVKISVNHLDALSAQLNYPYNDAHCFNEWLLEWWDDFVAAIAKLKSE